MNAQLKPSAGANSPSNTDCGTLARKGRAILTCEGGGIADDGTAESVDRNRPVSSLRSSSPPARRDAASDSAG